MRYTTVLAICALITGCGVAEQPARNKTVTAYEVPLPSQAGLDEFLSILRVEAQAREMRVFTYSRQELAVLAKNDPPTAMTMNAAVWRGDDEVVATAMDGYNHLGEIWVAFSKGGDPALNRGFRESVMREVMARWPTTLSLPIMPTGAIPLPQDLIRTPRGDVVNPAAARKYGLGGPRDTDKRQN